NAPPVPIADWPPAPPLPPPLPVPLEAAPAWPPVAAPPDPLPPPPIPAPPAWPPAAEPPVPLPVLPPLMGLPVLPPLAPEPEPPPDPPLPGWLLLPQAETHRTLANRAELRHDKLELRMFFCPLGCGITRGYDWHFSHS